MTDNVKLKDKEILEEFQEEPASEEASETAEGQASEQSAEDAQEKTENAAEPEKEVPSAEAVESERYQRLFAEFSNYKRRTEKEKADLYAYAGEKFATGLLEVIDNFERAMAAKPEDDKFADGMELILVQLKGVLEKNKVEEIKALGEPFDPVYHHAVMMEEVEGTESGIVTKVMQKGYTLNGKVIRPAMVAVSQ